MSDLTLTEPLSDLKRRLLSAGYKVREINTAFNVDETGRKRTKTEFSDPDVDYEIKLHVAREFGIPVKEILDSRATITLN